MKILQVINSLATGGAEKLLLDTLPLYHQKGISVDLLVLNGSETPFLKKLKEKSCCQIFSLGTGSVYNPLLIFKMIPYLRQYDLVHVHLFPAQYWTVFAKLLSFSKARLLFTEHNTHNRRMASKVFRLIDRFVYSFYTRVVCITAEVQTVLQQHLHSSASKFLVIHNGVDLDSITATPPYGSDFLEPWNTEGAALLLQVAGFREQKDQATLIRALALLPTHVHLLLVGDGVTKSSCEVLVASLQLQNRVHFLGLRMDVAALLKTVDVVVLSSHYEGLSLSSIEGMAAGKPFVASNVPGLTEVVSEAGLLFECGNEKELAAHIQALLKDPIYYQQVATACQERAQEFTIEKMVAAHIEMYRKILNEN
jgi:glycosyltransferase involved in cell wall biosynthesis